MKLPTLFLTVAAFAIGLTVNAHSSVAETQVSHASRAIAMEVLIVRANWGPNDERPLTLSGPTDEVAARLRGLESEGQILATDRISLTTLENEETQIHLGKTTPVASADLPEGQVDQPRRRISTRALARSSRSPPRSTVRQLSPNSTSRSPS